MRGQRGQAIVLIAIMLAVVVGMAALAIDGSRAYALRRDLQAAVDSAALAATDRLQQTGSYSNAEQAAATIFGTNLRLYTAPSCTPGYGTPGAVALTVVCTYSDGSTLTEVVSALGPGGSGFTLTGRRALALQFARILTNGATPNLQATAGGNVNNLLYQPTVAALSQSGCGGVGGTAISVNGSGTLRVTGDIVSSGAISDVSGSVRVAGDVYARCQSPVPGAVTNACYPSGAATPCTYPDVAGATRSGFRFADPGYPPPAVPGGSQGRPGADVVISPGSFAANPAIAAAKCYFLSGGVYKWQGGFTTSGGFISNELKPPDEPNTSDNTQLANPQFWDTNGVNCAGSFDLTVSGGGPTVATYGVELTSVRNDTYAGTSYDRESAPSACQTLRIKAFSILVTLDVSNVPGAESYNVYLSPNGCAGPFGLVSNIPVSGPVQNTSTSHCPFGNGGNVCSLGDESVTVPAALISSLPLPNLFAAPDTSGAYPPDPETAPLHAGLPNQNPDRAVAPAGDRANENQCDTRGAALTTCPGDVTPGAVEFYLPSGGCMNNTNAGDTFVFSGYHYDWLVVYEPGATNPPANSCANVIAGDSFTAYVGLAYMPAASLTVSGVFGFSNEATGGLLANTITFNGALPTIVSSSDFMPVPPAGRLVG